VDQRKARSLADGACWKCRKAKGHKTANGAAYECLRCWMNVVAAAWFGRGDDRRAGLDVLAWLWETQLGRCAYTGAILIPFVNASLDHKRPRCKGGGTEEGNLQWVTKDVNMLKGHLEHDDFVDLCRIVAERAA